MAAGSFLVTGATGFLGRHMLELLRDQDVGHQLYPLVRNPESWSDEAWTSELGEVNLVKGSVTDFDALDAALGDTHLTGMFHFAALVRHSRKDSEEVYETNVEGTLNMVRLAAKKGCRLIFVSTSGTVGVFDKLDEWADEESPYLEKKVKKWPYYHSKVVAEQKARALAAELGVELVIIRPPILLGPGDHRFRSSGHIIRVMRGKLPFLLRGGIHFVDIRDATQAIWAAMNHAAPKPVYHVHGTACSIDTFFDMVKDASGVAPPGWHLPVSVPWVLAQITGGIDRLKPGKDLSILPNPVVIEMAGKYWDVRSRYAKEDLNFVPREASETLNDTVAWLRAHHPKLSE